MRMQPPSIHQRLTGLCRRRHHHCTLRPCQARLNLGVKPTYWQDQMIAA